MCRIRLLLVGKNLSDRPLTRRGILSTLSSVYDPLGLISPVVLVGKQILQQLCADQLSWDDPLPESLESRWERWRTGVQGLGSLQIKMCFKPEGFGSVVSTELHHFSDASHCGYGQCSYLKLVNEAGQVHCSLVMSKSRVVPLKPITIPRLELSAAVVSVKISAILKQELDLKDVVECFWMDSKIVLGYIANDSRRFYVFVANRLQQIYDHTVQPQWRHIDTKANPADIASRGVSADDLMKEQKWFNGPDILWEPNLLVCDEEKPMLSTEDSELKKTRVLDTHVDEILDTSFCESLNTFSSWTRLKTVLALCLRFMSKIKRCLKKKDLQSENVQTIGSKNSQEPLILSVEELQEAECKVISAVQSVVFQKEIGILKRCDKGSEKQSTDNHIVKERKSLLKGSSNIYRLDPFIDFERLLRVGVVLAVLK